MVDYTRESIKALAKGMALSVADDLRPQGRWKYLQNIRIFTEGVIESRPRLNNFLSLTGSVNQVPHSVRTIINQIDNSFNRIVGAGTKLYSGNALVLPEKATGFSGKPLSFVPFRPEQSVEAYLYIADENKFVKISVSDVLSDVGIDPPTKAATWQIGKPERKIIDSIEAGSGAAWNNLTGTASAPTEETRVNTTIASYLKDGPEPNFASVVPAVFSPDIQRGAILKLNGAEEVMVEEVVPAALKTGVATISKISYDIGTTGMATIVLSVSSSDIRRDSVLYINSIEHVRVQEVTFDDKGIPSIRVSTVGSYIAGQTVIGKDSFRIYSTVAYAVGNTIIGKYIKSVITADGISSITRTFNADLSNTGTKPLTPEDILHISIKPSDPAALTEIQIQFNVSSTGVPFEENYFYYVITPNFFTASADQTTPTLSVIQQTAQRQELLREQTQRNNIFERILRNSDSGGYDPGIYDPAEILLPGSTTLGTVVETTLGQTQWKEIEVPLGEILKLRVGSDLSRTLKDVNAIRISVNAKAAVDISIDSIWVGGSDALNSNPIQGFLPYNYVWRVRDPATKEVSNWSPPLRTGIKLSRGRVVLTFPAANTNYPATYKIDIARFGGTLNDFRIVGSIKNDGSTYTDTSSDRLIADNELAGRLEGGNPDAVFDYYKPFAILDTPKTGTCDIIGTNFIWKTGDKLNTTYPRGTLIVINGKANRFYSSPSSIEKVELEVDMGSLTNVVFEILSPLLTAQTLPIIFGPFGEGNFGLFFFGLGDKKNAGTLYWLDGNSPGTMSDLNRLEITSPSEPLMSGVIYDGLGYVYTTRRSFQLVPTFDGSAFSFIARENSNSRGLYSRYAICVGRDYIYSLSENADGIYRVPGNGNPERISATIDNLFYNNGKAPQPVTLIDGTIVYPPDFSKKDDLRLFHTGDYVHFRFIDTNNKQRTLVLDENLNDWISDDHYKNDIVGAIYHEEKESGTDILVGINDGIAKFENAGNYEADVVSKVIPFAFDAGDARLNKLFSEIIEDVDQGELGFTYRTYWNNGESAEAAEIIPGDIAHKRQQFISQINTGLGYFKKNTLTVLSWDIASGTKFYERIIYFIPLADEIKDRAGDIFLAPDNRLHLWTGVTFRADTFDTDKEIKFFDDLAVLRATITIDHNSRTTKVYKFPVPFVSKTIRRTSNDGIPWINYLETYEFDKEAVIPDPIEDDTGITFVGDGTLKYWRGVVIAANTFGINKELKFYDENNNLIHTQVINHNGYSIKSYDFPLDFISHSVRYASTDGVVWANYFIKYEFDPRAIIFETWQNTFGQVFGNEISPLRLWEGFNLEARTFTDQTLKFYDDNGVLQHTEVISHSDGKTKSYKFSYPFISRMIKMTAEALPLWILYNIKYDFDTAITIPETWEELIGITDTLGDASTKYWQGLILEANTLGQNKELKFYDEQRILRHTEIINRDNRKTKEFSFDEPFMSHTIRMVSDDGVRWGYYIKQYIADVEPESAKIWEGEFNVSNIPGLKLISRMGIAYRSEADAILKLKFDTNNFVEYPLPNSNGEFHIERFYIACAKWNATKYRLESSEPFRWYKKSSEVWIKSINSSEPFRPIAPFGGPSNQTEILI